MSQINPFSGYAAGSSQALRTQSAEKDRQIRRARHHEEDPGLEEDEVVLEVEGPDALSPIQDREPAPERQKQQPAPDDDEVPHLDVTG
jgi:hypothetical protein